MELECVLGFFVMTGIDTGTGQAAAAVNGGMNEQQLNSQTSIWDADVNNLYVWMWSINGVIPSPLRLRVRCLVVETDRRERECRSRSYFSYCLLTKYGIECRREHAVEHVALEERIQRGEAK